MSRIDREEPESAEQAAETKAAYGKTEPTRITVKSVLHEHRAERRDQAAQQAGEKNGRKCLAQVRPPCDGSDASAGMTKLQLTGIERRPLEQPRDQRVVRIRRPLRRRDRPIECRLSRLRCDSLAPARDAQFSEY
jgi:hypothetical protein